MIRRLAALVLSLVAPPAAAEEMPLLGPAEIEGEILGTHLYGHAGGPGFKFDECIDPEGYTVYRTYPEGAITPYSEEGHMVATETAQACFSYPPGTDPTPSCFRVFRSGAGYVFDSVGTGDRFIVTRVVRGVTECPLAGALIG